MFRPQEGHNAFVLLPERERDWEGEDGAEGGLGAQGYT